MEEENQNKDGYDNTKFKSGKYCGFRENNKCNTFCGLFNIGLGGCVLHSMNMNLQKITGILTELKNKMGK